MPSIHLWGPSRDALTTQGSSASYEPTCTNSWSQYDQLMMLDPPIAVPHGGNFFTTCDLSRPQPQICLTLGGKSGIAASGTAPKEQHISFSGFTCLCTDAREWSQRCRKQRPSFGLDGSVAAHRYPLQWSRHETAAISVLSMPGDPKWGCCLVRGQFAYGTFRLYARRSPNGPDHTLTCCFQRSTARPPVTPFRRNLLRCLGLAELWKREEGAISGRVPLPNRHTSHRQRRRPRCSTVERKERGAPGTRNGTIVKHP